VRCRRLRARLLRQFARRSPATLTLVLQLSLYSALRAFVSLSTTPIAFTAANFPALSPLSAHYCCARTQYPEHPLSSPLTHPSPQLVSRLGQAHPRAAPVPRPSPALRCNASHHLHQAPNDQPLVVRRHPLCASNCRRPARLRRHCCRLSLAALARVSVLELLRSLRGPLDLLPRRLASFATLPLTIP
jgi:hypothetical protein